MPAVNLTLWYEALGSPLGIIIETDDPVKARARLYAFRKEANDPDLEQISILPSPTNPSHLWLIKRKPL